MYTHTHTYRDKYKQINMYTSTHMHKVLKTCHLKSVDYHETREIKDINSKTVFKRLELLR